MIKSFAHTQAIAEHFCRESTTYEKLCCTEASASCYLFTNAFSKHKSNRLYSCKCVRYTAGKETVWQADIQNKS